MRRKFDGKKRRKKNSENCLHELTQFVFLKKKYFNEQNHTQRIWFLFVIGNGGKEFFFILIIRFGLWGWNKPLAMIIYLFEIELTWQTKKNWLKRNAVITAALLKNHRLLI